MNKEYYALESVESTKYDYKIFLAGPTPRDKQTESWRPEMVKILRESGYDGDILIPEKRGNYMDYDYESQTKWEVENLNLANLILFWIPRELNTMPAFTTNIEFGEFMHSGKIVLAYPKDAPKMRYLKVRADMHDIPVIHSIKEVAEYAVRCSSSSYYNHNILS